MKPLWLLAEVQVPLSRAICDHAEHPRQRTVLKRTALGPAKKPYLLKLMNDDVSKLPLEHGPLQVCLYDLGQAFVQMAEKSGYKHEGILMAQGPRPVFEAGQPSVMDVRPGDPDRTADYITKHAGFVTDRVGYRLLGRFIGDLSQPSSGVVPVLAGEGETPCHDLGEQTTQVA